MHRCFRAGKGARVGAGKTTSRLVEALCWLTPAEATRWADSNPTFARNLRTSSGGQLLQVLTQLENISGGIGGIREALGRE